MFSPPVCLLAFWLVGLSGGLCKNHSVDFQENQDKSGRSRNIHQFVGLNEEDKAY